MLIECHVNVSGLCQQNVMSNVSFMSTMSTECYVTAVNVI